jgi:Primase C terminal 2 (PriCT-2)
MALFAASGGSEAGLAAFDRFSQQSAKYDAAETRHRWEHYRQSPPDRLGPGTLVYEARQADPSFRLPSRQGGAGTPARGPTGEASPQVVRPPVAGEGDADDGPLPPGYTEDALALVHRRVQTIHSAGAPVWLEPRSAGAQRPGRVNLLSAPVH